MPESPRIMYACYKHPDWYVSLPLGEKPDETELQAARQIKNTCNITPSTQACPGYCAIRELLKNNPRS